MNSRKESERYGLAQRKRLPRSALGELAERRFDPIDVLRQSCAGHLPALLPLKFERMSASPFAFFRGSVEIMAADLGAAPRTAIEVQLCGDAHLKNFGFFATPGAEIVLDINDFDQTTRGPWEWDIKRMAVSIVLAGQVAGDSKSQLKTAVRKFLDDYVAWIRRFASMPTLDVARHRATRDSHDPLILLALDKAERSTPLSNLKRFAHKTKSGYRFRCEPGLIWEVKGTERKAVLAALPRYRSTLVADHQLLFDRFEPVDVGFRVVGTGSVGTRDYVVLFLGYDDKDPLFLQIKEEPPSAYVAYYKDRSAPRHQGERVVRGQHAMQVLSDPLLGWCSIERRDYLVRQLSDHKSSIEPELLKGGRLVAYSRVCAELLAKAHARSGDPAALASYLGASAKAGRALLEFALKYAEQVERDFAAFKKALKREHGLAQAAKNAASQPK